MCSGLQVDENEPWGSLTKEGKQNEAAKAFAQMEKVKKLFEATREGTPEVREDYLFLLLSLLLLSTPSHTPIYT